MDFPCWPPTPSISASHCVFPRYMVCSWYPLPVLSSRQEMARQLHLRTQPYQLFLAWIWSSTYRCTATGSKFPFPDNDFHQEDTDYPGQAALNRTCHNAVNSIPTGFWRLQQYWFLTMRARTIRTTEYTGCRNQPTGQAVSRQPCSWHITQHRLRLMSWTGRYQGDAIYGVGDCEQPQVRLISWVLSAIRLEQ